MYGRILKVYPGSLAEELELVPGDKLLEINGTRLRDIIDVSFAFADEEIEMLVEHEDGQQEVYEFDKDYDEELGAEFESAVFDGIRHCANNCLFCFVDQVAPDMRESLNIKDDDYRMSFLYGNFITMTNMVDADFQRIKQYHLSPLFVSVQCTNPDLRQRLLRCRTAGNLAAQLDKLEAADVEYHTQIVLCRELNDGAELERSLRDLVARQPHALSVAIVPVGLTRFRQDRYPLKSFDKESAARVVEQVEAYQRQQREKDGRTFIYLADEFYLLAGRELPPAEYYDGFPQLDNGIGLARNFMEEFAAALAEADDSKAALAAHKQQDNRDNQAKLRLAVVSGTSISPLLAELAASVSGAGVQVTMVPVPNHHFGTTVNVSGLLTAKDMLEALADVAGSVDGVLVPESALRTGDNVFLDDVSLSDFRAQLPCRAETVGSGRAYFHALTDWDNYSGVGDTAASYMWQSNAAYTKRGGM
ncbi:DUF512 domain-containing protein [Anaerovibrio sp.]|uniref:DUF512 domain-containing protein n=1 Tax=Anaerovibrio sp. TaxID=1872532 RepID=UPI0026036E0B|nr:DUF512 domain-containing protein [Anaerovibrio sp.]MDD6598810.1 DUF512 domain-containing protein [Anaerovibrio sp.]